MRLTTGDERNTGAGVGKMPYEHNSELVELIHQACRGNELPDVLAALVTVTVDSIHLIEHEVVRERVEADFVKALGYVSAVEARFHGQLFSLVNEDGEDGDRSHEDFNLELLEKVRYRLFVGDDNQTLLAVGESRIVSQQIAAARGLVGWSQQQLADQSGTSLNDIAQLEQGAVTGPSPALSAIHKSLVKAGVEFLPGVTGTKGEGVMLRWPARRPGPRWPAVTEHTNRQRE